MQKLTSAAALSSGAPAPRMLIVDDDAYVGRALSRIIGDPWEVDVMVDGHDALARLEGGEIFDCILCDMRMPTMTGPDFLEAVRALGTSQHDRVIFVTGGRQMRDVEEFLSTVPNPCLEKPFTRDDLRAVVQKVAPHFRGPCSGVWRRTP